MAESRPEVRIPVDALTPEQIERLDSDALRRALRSIVRPGEVVAAGHKNHGSHSNIVEN